MENLWKITRDKFYGELFWQHGLEFITEAGFFADSSTEDENIAESVNTLCTPVAFLKKDLPNPCVLLSTGSFCPLHEGHIKMMEKAKEAVEKKGFQVAGAYFSPGHDEYIKSKTGDEWIPIHNRIQIIREMTKPYPWINVDPWEGTFTKVAVNFTDVVYRLGLYLKEHLGKEIPVFFVCGGDNARFVKAFSNHGHCVVVDRPPYHSFTTYKDALNESTYKRIIFAGGGIEMSSSWIRSVKKFSPPIKKDLNLRLGKTNARELAVAEKLKPYFSEITHHYIEDQKKLYHNMAACIMMISMDPYIEGDREFSMSREYDLFGTTMLGYTHRPGSRTLEQQVARIPRDHYGIYDDDIHTGNSIRFARKCLEADGRIVIDSVHSFNISETGNREILDARDFLFGFDEHSGLVVRLPNGRRVRVPYMYPFVCPFTRASVNTPMSFSTEMWKLNMELHDDLLVCQVPHLADLYDFLGYEAETKIKDICKHYYEMCKELE